MPHRSSLALALTLALAACGSAAAPGEGPAAKGGPAPAGPAAKGGPGDQGGPAGPGGPAAVALVAATAASDLQARQTIDPGLGIGQLAGSSALSPSCRALATKVAADSAATEATPQFAALVQAPEFVKISQVFATAAVHGCTQASTDVPCTGLGQALADALQALGGTAEAQATLATPASQQETLDVQHFATGCLAGPGAPAGPTPAAH